MTAWCNCCSYDPREDKWTVLAEMETARALAGCTVYQNKIYVIGTLVLFSSAYQYCSLHDFCWLI